MSTCSAQGPHLRDLKHCVEEVKQTIEKSDAMLYAPSTDDIKVGCPPCEAYSLKNITVFLARLNHLLEERIASQMAN